MHADRRQTTPEPSAADPLSCHVFRKALHVRERCPGAARVERMDGSEHLIQQLGCQLRREGGVGVKAVIMAVRFHLRDLLFDLTFRAVVLDRRLISVRTVYEWSVHSGDRAPRPP